MTKMKEKIEEINVMEGIDFEKNQRRTRRIQARLKKEKRLYKILYVLTVIAILLGLIIILELSSRKAFKSCVENGMSAEWCEVHVQ